MKIEDLREKQRWSLDQKIDHSLGVIDQFLSRVEGKAYVSFSGGKDSTVMLDLCRIIKPDIKAVFCNTGNEYPDIVRFVRETKDAGVNVEIIYPKMKPKDVFAKYGFPLVNKEQAQFIREAKHTNSEKLRRIRVEGFDGEKQRQGRISKKWLPLIDCEFNISEKCCQKLKKDPFHKYEKETGLFGIRGEMASESFLRTSQYLIRGGCNAFSDTGRRTGSFPLSIWMDEDVYAYIAKRNLKIAGIYHKGATRTGCMFCGFGCHLKGDDRFEIIKKQYPKMYDMFTSYTNNGVSYIEAINIVNKL